MRLFFKHSFFICFLCLPQIASAHSPIKGMGDFLNGVLHPLLVPEQVLLLLGLGLFYGQHHVNRHKKNILYFMSAIITGLFLGDFLQAVDLSLPLLLLALMINFFVLIKRDFYRPVFIFLVVLSGLLLGLDSTQAELTGKAKLVTLFGSGIGMYFLMLYTMALSETFSTPQWRVIAVRILASWLSASALMVLALRFVQ